MNAEADGRLRRLAERQDGVFHRDQATHAGANDDFRSQRIGSGAWVPVGAMAYRMAGAPPTWRGIARAALWDAGDRALVTHGAAARMHRFPGFADAAVEVLVPKSLDHVCTIATIRESRRFQLVRAVPIGGLHVVAPEDTVVHICARLRFKRLDWLVDELLPRRSFDLARLHDAFAALSPGCHGTRNLRKVLEDRAPGEPILESRLEKLFLKVAAAHGLPPFSRQAAFEGRDRRPGRIDFLWPEVRLIVETDGRRWHARRADFERDHRRDLAALARGYRTARITWAMLTAEPRETCRDLLAARDFAA